MAFYFFGARPDHPESQFQSFPAYRGPSIYAHFERVETLLFLPLVHDVHALPRKHTTNIYKYHQRNTMEVLFPSKPMVLSWSQLSFHIPRSQWAWKRWPVAGSLRKELERALRVSSLLLSSWISWSLSWNLNTGLPSFTWWGHDCKVGNLCKPQLNTKTIIYIYIYSNIIKYIYIYICVCVLLLHGLS